MAILTKLVYTLSGTEQQLTSSDLYNVTYSHNVNNGSQLTVGTVSSAQLTFQAEVQIPIGTNIDYFCDQEDGRGFVLIGKFIVTDSKTNRNRFDYTCYDYISKFDKVVDSWYNSLSYPLNIGYGSATTILGSLCSYVGVSQYECQPRCNGTWNINSKKFNANFLNGKYILGLIAQIAGGYACADENGKIWLRTFGKDNYSYGAGDVTTFTPPSTTLTFSDYTSLELADYDCPRITQLNIQYDYTGNVHTINWDNNPSGQPAQPSILDLKSNPWTYDHTATQIKNNYWDCPDGSFWRFQNYRPCKVKLQTDHGLKAGDYFYVKDNRSQNPAEQTTYLTLIMSKTITSNGVVFECDGERIRDEVAASTEQKIDLSSYVTKPEVEPIIVEERQQYNINYTNQTISIYDPLLNRTVQSSPVSLIYKTGNVTQTHYDFDGVFINRGSTGQIASKLTQSGLNIYNTSNQIASQLTNTGTLVLRNSSGTATLTKSDIDLIHNIAPTYYIHTVRLYKGSSNYFFSFVHSSSSSVSIENWLATHGHSSANTCYPCSGTIKGLSTVAVNPCIGIFYANAKIGIVFDDMSFVQYSDLTAVQTVKSVNIP